MSLAIQNPLEIEEQRDLQKAIEASRADASSHAASLSNLNLGASTSRSTLDNTLVGTPHDLPSRNVLDHGSDDEDLYASPTRLETALSIAGAGPVHKLPSNTGSRDRLSGSLFGKPTLLMAPEPVSTPEPELAEVVSDSEGDLEEVPVLSIPSTPPRPTSVLHDLSPAAILVEDSPLRRVPPVQMIESDDEDEEQFILPTLPQVPIVHSPGPVENSFATIQEVDTTDTRSEVVSIVQELVGEATIIEKRPSAVSNISDTNSESSSEEEIQWSRSPSPNGFEKSGEPNRKKPEDIHEDWDAAHEMDPQAEEGEYARFISHVKGKDLETVRREIDEEIKALNQQRKAAMRDSEDITQQMIAQIMVSSVSSMPPVR